MQFAVASITDFYSNYSASFFILLVIAVYFHSATGLRLTAPESSSVEFIKVEVVVLLFALLEVAARAVIHSFLLWVYFLGGAAEAGNKADKGGGNRGRGSGGRGKWGGESSAVNQKR